MENIMELVIQLAVVILAFVAIKWYRNTKDQALKDLIDDTVLWAEQTFGPGGGELKKENVLNTLTMLGINTTKKIIDILIESAVLRLT